MSETQFDPEVLALLDEIARSPEGRLLHVPRERLPNYFGDPGETISPHGSFLSKAERHLVAAYREQAARVLLEACILRLKEDPQIYSTIRGDEKNLRPRARALSSRLQESPGSSEALDALARGTDLTVTELAMSSVRLAPCDLGFNALALCYQREERFRSALRVLERFYDGAAQSLQRAQAFANMAHVYAQRKEFQRAHELGLQACAFEGTRSRFAAWCLATAIQGGHERSALECACRLDERVDDSDFSEVVEGLKQARSRGSWTPTPAGKNLIVRLQAGPSPRTRVICEVFS